MTLCFFVESMFVGQTVHVITKLFVRKSNHIYVGEP